MLRYVCQPMEGQKRKRKKQTQSDREEEEHFMVISHTLTQKHSRCRTSERN